MRLHKWGKREKEFYLLVPIEDSLTLRNGAKTIMISYRTGGV
jgi:hypothetical protein